MDRTDKNGTSDAMARRRAHTLREILVWNLTVLLALVYLWSGWQTFSGADTMATAFARFGLPDWFRITIGIIEFVGGLMLLLRPVVGLVALGLSVLMLGAILTHVIHDPWYQFWDGFVLLLLLISLMALRRPVIPPLLQRWLC